MSEIRCVYLDQAPPFPASDQHPEAQRFGPIVLPGGRSIYVDAIGGEPTIDAVGAVLDPPLPPVPTPTERLAAAGLTVEDLRSLLGLPHA